MGRMLGPEAGLGRVREEKVSCVAGIRNPDLPLQMKFPCS